MTWSEKWCGETEFLMVGYRIEFFQDCGGLDYLECATASDGRKSWYEVSCLPGIDPARCQLTCQAFEILLEKLEQAPWKDSATVS